MTQDEDRVGHELLHAVAGEFPTLLNALCRENRGYPEPLKSGIDPDQLASNQPWVGQLGKECAYRVDCDPLGPYLVDGVLEPGQQAAKVIGPGLDHSPILVGGGIDEGPLACFLPVCDLPAHAPIVRPESLGGLLEGHKDPLLTPLSDSLSEELGDEGSLGTACGTGHQRSTPLG